jgi:hypothetical protein
MPQAFTGNTLNLDAATMPRTGNSPLPRPTGIAK